MEKKDYAGVVKLFGIFTIDSIETIIISVYSNPEKWSYERLKSINPILRVFCIVKWIQI